MAPSPKARCVVCSTECGRRDTNRFFPFCSERCKWVDLGRWMNEDYVISEPLSPEEHARAGEPDGGSTGLDS